jgi:hypothetical protein
MTNSYLNNNSIKYFLNEYQDKIHQISTSEDEDDRSSSLNTKTDVDQASQVILDGIKLKIKK